MSKRTRVKGWIICGSTGLVVLGPINKEFYTYPNKEDALGHKLPNEIIKKCEIYIEN